MKRKPKAKAAKPVTSLRPTRAYAATWDGGKTFSTWQAKQYGYEDEPHMVAAFIRRKDCRRRFQGVIPVIIADARHYRVVPRKPRRKA